MSHFSYRVRALTVLCLLAACSAQPNKEGKVEDAEVVLPSVVVSDAPVPAPIEVPQSVEANVSILHEESQRREPPSIASKTEMAKSKMMVSGVMHDQMNMIAPAPPYFPPNYDPQNAERYESLKDNGVIATKDDPVSTFSVDVDTASYANIRRYINNGQRPPRDAVRIEEMINYFDYDYAAPSDGEVPFRVHTELAPTPWASNSYLLQIGIKGYTPPQNNIARNLVFLLDVSGSMNEPNKLPLVKQSLRLLVNQLSEKDNVAIVVYAGAAGVVLPATSGNKHQEILTALNKLQAGGSTNGGQGIQRAYELAEQSFKKNGVNRVILATDGDFNVGTTGTEELLSLIKNKKRSGVGLTVLAMGMGNLNDQMLEAISNAGDGNAAYIDTLQEAKKVLVTDVSATLQTIAKDTKIQMEFNPEIVSHYRLIGYENRMLQQQDFSNDRVDAGDIGAGHTVTAMYEITLKQAGRYDRNDHKSTANTELGFLKMRYKRPSENKSIELSQAIYQKDIQTDLGKTSNNYRFASAVAGFGQILRGNKNIGDYQIQDVMDLAQNSVGKDQYGYRSEFLSLLSQYESISSENQQPDYSGPPIYYQLR